MEVDHLDGDREDGSGSISLTLPASPVCRLPICKAASRSSNRVKVAEPASAAHRAPTTRKASTAGSTSGHPPPHSPAVAPPLPPAVAPPLSARPLTLMLPPPANLAPSTAAPSAVTFPASTTAPPAMDYTPVLPGPRLVGRKAATARQAALEKQCGILRPSTWALPWDPSTSTMLMFCNSGKPV
jgi:hypothetical protein